MYGRLETRLFIVQNEKESPKMLLFLAIAFLISYELSDEYGKILISKSHLFFSSQSTGGGRTVFMADMNHGCCENGSVSQGRTLRAQAAAPGSCPVVSLPLKCKIPCSENNNSRVFFPLPGHRRGFREAIP
jgi:hypothetical protein